MPVDEAECGYRRCIGYFRHLVGETTQIQLILTGGLSMKSQLIENFMANSSPFAAKVGKYATSRHTKERLERVEVNVGLVELQTYRFI